MTLQRVFMAFGRTLGMALCGLVVYLAMPFILLGVLILYLLGLVAVVGGFVGIVCLLVGSYRIGLTSLGIGGAAFAVSVAAWDRIYADPVPVVRRRREPDAIPASSLRIDFNR